jgi:hypothetical protein
MDIIRADVSDVTSFSIIRMTRIGELISGLVFLRRVRRLLLAAKLLNSPMFVTLLMKALSSYKPSVLIRTTRRNIPEDDILHSHRRENLKSYIALTGWTL